VVGTTYGNPAPYIRFQGTGAANTLGEVAVTAGGQSFTFQSVDLYSSVTQIPYEITGIANAATVFTLQGAVPNTFGRFATVSNSSANVKIDTLVIRLTNPAIPTHPSASNPMGLDNLVLKY